MNRKQRKRKWEVPVQASLQVASPAKIRVNPTIISRHLGKLAEVAMPAYAAGSMARLVSGLRGVDRLPRAAGASSARGNRLPGEELDSLGLGVRRCSTGGQVQASVISRNAWPYCHEMPWCVSTSFVVWLGWVLAAVGELGPCGLSSGPLSGGLERRPAVRNALFCSQLFVRAGSVRREPGSRDLSSELRALRDSVRLLVGGRPKATRKADFGKLLCAVRILQGGFLDGRTIFESQDEGVRVSSGGSIHRRGIAFWPWESLVRARRFRRQRRAAIRASSRGFLG